MKFTKEKVRNYKEKYASSLSLDYIATMPMHELYKNIENYRSYINKLSSKGECATTYECELAWLERELHFRQLRKRS